LAGAGAGENAGLSENHLTDLWLARQREQDDVAARRQVGDRSGGFYPVPAEPLQRLRSHIECQHRASALLREVTAHRFTHDAEADEAHHLSCFHLAASLLS